MIMEALMEALMEPMEPTDGTTKNLSYSTIFYFIIYVAILFKYVSSAVTLIAFQDIFWDE